MRFEALNRQTHCWSS